jgi:hypothetical protein
VVDGDSSFAHRFEQAALGARRRPIDLIGEDDVGKQRAGLELELSRLLVPHRHADHI